MCRICHLSRSSLIWRTGSQCALFLCILHRYRPYGSLEASSSSLGSVTFPLIDLSLVCKVGPGHRSPRLRGGLGRVLRVAVRDLEFPSVWLREESTFPHHCHCPPLAAFLGLAFSTSILSWGLIQVVARFNSLLLFIAE